MAGGIVLRNGVKLLGSLPAGTGDPILTVDNSSKDVGTVPSIDSSTFVSTVLTSGYLVVGNASNVATPRQVTGQISISNTGVVSITSDTITNSHINSAAVAVRSVIFETVNVSHVTL